MTRSDRLVAGFLIAVGCLTVAGDLSNIAVLKALGLATQASPAPKVFTAQDGFETYANRFFIGWTDDAGQPHEVELTPRAYAGLAGPYNRRNVYGAAMSYGPVLDRNPVTRPMFRSVLERSFCGTPPVFSELGVPPDAGEHGPVRIRLEPRRPEYASNFGLTFEIDCRA